MGIGDRSAMPDHLDEQHEVEANFKDDDQLGWFGRFRKSIKHWYAFSWRSPKGVAFSMFPPFVVARKWREIPKVLFCIKGKGPWRWESSDGSDTGPMITGKHYVTRCQLWTRWHVSLQWPLFFSCHFYPKASDVIPAGTRADRDGKLWLFYVGAKRDPDTYWYLSLFAGRNWK